MSRIDLSHSARADLMSIDLATIDRFGIDQSIRLEHEFQSAFAALSTNTGMGHDRPDFSPPGRSFRYWVVLQRFVIVYEPVADGIRIARILDGARDLPATLAEDQGDDRETESE